MSFQLKTISLQRLTYKMIVKDGFLLIELMIGLILSIFLILIITHYIFEVRNVQQEAIARIEALTLARNTIEKIIAHKGVIGSSLLPQAHKFVITTTQEPFMEQQGNNSFIMNKVTVKWKKNNKNRSVSIYGNIMVMEKINE